ncbi:TPA: hypothetical protein QCU06_005738 [Bacillus cereus]|nr:hypothetical protein [Bacillus cereus]
MITAVRMMQVKKCAIAMAGASIASLRESIRLLDWLHLRFHHSNFLA